MTIYPSQFDTDNELPVIDDSVTEWSGEPFNKTREAVLTIERTLGINPQGLAGSVSERINVSLDESGNLRSSAIAALGLLTNITDFQIDVAANIDEEKLNLAYKTYTLYALIQALSAQTNAVNTFAGEIYQDIFGHLNGDAILVSGFGGRHVASQIDTDTVLLEAIQPDMTGTWSGTDWAGTGLGPYLHTPGTAVSLYEDNLTIGLLYRTQYTISGRTAGTLTQYAGTTAGTTQSADGTYTEDLVCAGNVNHSFLPSADFDGSVTIVSIIAIRPVTEVMGALTSINNELTWHQTSTTDQHEASAVSIDTSGFEVIPQDKTDVQKAINYIDEMGRTIYGEFGAILNSNGITRIASAEDLNTDGYSTLLLTPQTFAVETIVSSVDNIDDVVNFFIGPSPNTADQLDALFSSISIGDYITINYGGYVSTFTINGILFDPQFTWKLKIDGVNLEAKSMIAPAYAYIEQKKYDDNTFGNLAVCPANHDLQPDYDNIPHSVIIVTPKSAQVLGLDLNLTDLDSTHYNLYIDFYPEGNVSEIIALPAIDVTGNQGMTPGQYTLEDVIKNTNNGFRAAGFNYRMVAFERSGQFGLAIADHYGNPGFSIRSGIVVAGVLTEDLPYNVIGNNRNNPALSDMKDALGLGNQKANVASPVYSPVQAALPTKIFVGKKNKKFNVFGTLTDQLAKDATTNSDGYWLAEVEGQTQNALTIETVYIINQDLARSKIRSGSTIVVLPAIDKSESDYNIADYGRYFVKSIEFEGCEPNISTRLTTINGVHSLGIAKGDQTPVGLSVHIYHCDDSVTFDPKNLADGAPDVDTKRLYEIFVNTSGETVAYERLRFDITAGETATGLVTDSRSFGWHVINVSPKLLGYVDSSLQNRRFMTLSITDYNSSDSSFKAQLSDPGSAQNVGPIAIGRKDEVLRVYDHTGVDYIDLIFDDQFSAYVIPDTTLTLEVFLTQSLNQEFLCIGSCCQLFIPVTASGGPISFIKDRRGFGTISEKILSDSAISFIESNNRLLHENSIINGLDYISGVDNLLFYNGGTANINGKIVNKNGICFTIFPLALDGINEYSKDIVLCLDENGNVWWAPLTTDGSFITISAPVDTSTASNTNIKAYPFEYIVNNRKDLVPFSVVTLVSKIDGTVPILISAAAKDVRRFLREAQPNIVTVTGEILGSDNNSSVTGNFASLDAASEYVYLTRMSKPKMVIKGSVVLDTEVVLSDAILEGAPYNLVRVGDNGSLSILGNTKISGLKFQREYSNAETAYEGTALAKGTITVLCQGQNTYSDIIIENCSFNTLDGYTASFVPHILMEQDGARSTIKNVTINNNTFNEDFEQVIIAFISRNGSTTYGTVLNGIRIENNKSNHLSIIMISSDATEDNEMVGLETYGVNINKNMFGHLWLNASRHSWVGIDSGADGLETTYLTSTPIIRNITNTFPDDPVDFTTFYTMSPDINIVNNIMYSIEIRTINGDSRIGEYCHFATPSILINGNNCSKIEISVVGQGSGQNAGPGEIIICNNKLQANSYSDGETAIYIAGTLIPDSVVPVNIHNNVIQSPTIDYSGGGGYKYTTAISTEISAHIHHNTINKCFSDYGIYLGFLSSVSDANSIVSNVNNNIITRGAETISNYIYVYYNNTVKLINIIDNTFDSTTVDGAIEDVISIVALNAAAKLANRRKIRAVRNINQQVTLDILNRISNNEIYDLTNNIIGWVHRTFTVFESISMITPMIPLSHVSSGRTYSLAGLRIDVPLLDGAMPIKVNIEMGGTRLAGDITIYPMAIGAEDSSFCTSDDSRQFTVSPSNFMWNAASKSIEIDLSDLLIGGSAIDDYTTKTSVPIFLYFSSSAISLSFIEIYKDTSDIYDTFWLTEVTATYRY